ncbi:hypothetical protein QF022_003075 [Vogesella perlucida]|nr:hypothetical protein [Vogesella perlucida]
MMDAAGAKDLGHVVHAIMLVVAHAARVVVDDGLQRRQPVADFQQLVYLLLVFHYRHCHPGVGQRKHHFLRHRVLVQRYRNAAHALCRHDRHVQARAVVAYNRQAVAALEALGRQAQGQGTHFGGYLFPGPGLPDAEVFLAHGGALAALGGVGLQQLGKGVGHAFLGSGRAKGFRLCHLFVSPGFLCWPQAQPGYKQPSGGALRVVQQSNRDKQGGSRGWAAQVMQGLWPCR